MCFMDGMCFMCQLLCLRMASLTMKNGFFCLLVDAVLLMAGLIQPTGQTSTRLSLGLFQVCGVKGRFWNFVSSTKHIPLTAIS